MGLSVIFIPKKWHLCHFECKYLLPSLYSFSFFLWYTYFFFNGLLYICHLYVPFCNMFLLFIMGLLPCQDFVFSGYRVIHYMNLCESARAWQCPAERHLGCFHFCLVEIRLFLQHKIFVLELLGQEYILLLVWPFFSKS